MEEFITIPQLQNPPTPIPKKTNWYLVLAWMIVIVVAIFVAGYYYVDKINSCTKDPFQYGVDRLKEKYYTTRVFGSVTLESESAPNGYSIGFGDLNIVKILGLNKKGEEILPKEDINLSQIFIPA